MAGSSGGSGSGSGGGRGGGRVLQPGAMIAPTQRSEASIESEQVLGSRIWPSSAPCRAPNGAARQVRSRGAPGAVTHSLFTGTTVHATCRCRRRCRRCSTPSRRAASARPPRARSSASSTATPSLLGWTPCRPSLGEPPLPPLPPPPRMRHRCCCCLVDLAAPQWISIGACAHVWRECACAHVMHPRALLPGFAAGLCASLHRAPACLWGRCFTLALLCLPCCLTHPLDPQLTVLLAAARSTPSWWQPLTWTLSWPSA